MTKPGRARVSVTALLGCPLLLAVNAWATAGAPSNEPISPITITTPADPAKVALGRTLFEDRRLSKGSAVSCSSCHSRAAGGADGLQTSIGINGLRTLRNAPSIFNAALNFRQGWDGRSESLEQQTHAVVHDSTVMASSWAEILSKLQADPAMVQRFKSVYTDGLQIKNIADALVTYERSLTTPNSRFDKYLRGDKSALTVEEVRGYGLFKSNGCVACHQGVGVGGNMFQTFGVMGERGAYMKDRGDPDPKDKGRYNRTGLEADRFVFKVPSLRNVALTAPYLHDGSAKTLEEAVDVMFKYQLGRTPDPQDVAAIVKFLKTLTGELDGKPLDRAPGK
jgi:cytochrome c peroxidase